MSHEFEEFEGGHREEAPKKRGRPPGSKTKPKESGATTKPATPHIVDSLAKQTMTAAVDIRIDQALGASLDEIFKNLDFKGLGTSPRWPLVLLEDVSPSEWKYKKDFREGGNSIPADMQNDTLGRSLVDVLYARGAEWFKVVSCAHAKSFKMPDKDEEGDSTEATPWLDGITQTIKAYRAHLAKHGLTMGGAVVVICSDFRFGDDFTDALERFRAFQKANPRVFVVPAGYGAWVSEVAERFSLDVLPKNLNEIRVSHFLKLVTKTLTQATHTRAEQRLKIVGDFNRLGE